VAQYLRLLAAMAPGAPTSMDPAVPAHDGDDAATDDQLLAVAPAAARLPAAELPTGGASHALFTFSCSLLTLCHCCCSPSAPQAAACCHLPPFSAF